MESCGGTQNFERVLKFLKYCQSLLCGSTDLQRSLAAPLLQTCLLPVGSFAFTAVLGKFRMQTICSIVSSGNKLSLYSARTHSLCCLLKATCCELLQELARISVEGACLRRLECFSGVCFPLRDCGPCHSECCHLLSFFPHKGRFVLSDVAILLQSFEQRGIRTSTQLEMCLLCLAFPHEGQISSDFLVKFRASVWSILTGPLSLVFLGALSSLKNAKDKRKREAVVSVITN